MSFVWVLRDLQVIDQELDRWNERLGVIAARLGDDGPLAPLRLRVDELRSASTRVTIQQHELENVVASYSAKISQVEAKLYGGSVTSPRELADLQADVGQVKRQRSEQEDQLLTVMEELEGVQREMDETTTQLETGEEVWRAEQKAMQQEQQLLEQEMAQGSAKRSTLVQRVAPGDISLYEQVRRRHGGLAVARVLQGRCGACRITLPTRELQQVRVAASPVLCSSCGRILLED